MAKTLVEKKICDACGADVRAGSLFCYNCGGAVSAVLPETNNNKKGVSNARVQNEPAESSDYKTSNIDLKTTRLKKERVENAEPETLEKPIEKPVGGEILLEKPEAKPIEKPSLREDAKLKSAANMRRKAKSFQRKRVEVVWEEPENAPNKWFPLVAIVLILFVIGIFYLAMYLK
jgi:hypothetical protein